MQRPKKLPKSSLKLQSYVNQPLDLVRQLEESRTRNISLHDASPFKRSQARTSLAKTNKRHNYFISSNEIASLNSIPFKNDAITQKILDNLLVAKGVESIDEQDFLNKPFQGLKPLFKIKKRKFYLKKQQKNQTSQEQMSQALKNSLWFAQNSRKSPIKTTIQTSFHKSYKSSLQKNRNRYKEKLQSNPEDFQYQALISRIQNTTLLGKYALKHIKMSPQNKNS